MASYYIIAQQCDVQEGNNTLSQTNHKKRNNRIPEDREKFQWKPFHMLLALYVIIAVIGIVSHMIN